MRADLVHWTKLAMSENASDRELVQTRRVGKKSRPVAQLSQSRFF
jgi:hypothetical protein